MVARLCGKVYTRFPSGCIDGKNTVPRAATASSVPSFNFGFQSLRCSLQGHGDVVLVVRLQLWRPIIAAHFGLNVGGEIAYETPAQAGN
jgi:hypothetical protein